jgi:GntR family transcriptional regulator
MALEFAPPRYAQLVTAIQERIMDGTYAHGALMPTEAQLGAEFGVSRATVVRALQLLKADGWIESHQGRGTYVSAKLGWSPDPVRRGAELFTEAEPPESRSTLLHVGPAPVPPVVASVLGLRSGDQAFLRRRLVAIEDETIELVSAWFPLAVAEGTGLDSPKPLTEGTHAHLERRKRITITRVSQRISASAATTEEANMLNLPRRIPLLNLLVTGYDSNDQPVQAVAVALPADRHELEDTYNL